MTQADSHDVPGSEIEAVATADRFRNVQFLTGSLQITGADANGPCFPCAMVQKALSMSTFNAGSRLDSWQKFFAYTLQNTERRSVLMPSGRPWTARCCRPRRTRNQRLKILTVIRLTEDEAAAKSICIWMVRGFPRE